MASSRAVPCPHCGALVAWSSENRFRPFCSERCKMVDLGAWLTEQHAIPGEPVEGAPEAAAPATPADGQR